MGDGSNGGCIESVSAVRLCVCELCVCDGSKQVCVAAVTAR